VYFFQAEVCASAFFALSRSRARSKKERESAEKNEHGKSESAKSERKKREFALFSSFAAQHWKSGSRA
jgi:hypothetical protein